MERLKLPVGPYQNPRVAPDGKRVAYAVDDGKDADIWVYDIARGGSPNRLTFGGKNRFPVWSPAGDQIAFQSDREGDLGIFAQRVDGNGRAERLTTPGKGVAHVPESWGPVGDTVLFRAFSSTVSAEASRISLRMLSLQDKKLAEFGGVQSSNPPEAVFSPDGRWVAYELRDADKYASEVYVQPFPATGAIYQLPITRDNHHPVWSRDGKALFYVPGPGEFASIAVTTTPTFAFGAPNPIKPVTLNYPPAMPRQYDVMPDGRILGKLPADQSTTGTPISPDIQVVYNWFEELKQRVPTQ